MKKKEPFLTTDVFDCGKQESCEKLFRSMNPEGGDFTSNNAMYTISKMKGIVFRILQLCYFSKRSIFSTLVVWLAE